MAQIPYRVLPALDNPRGKYERLSFTAKAIDAILRRVACNHGRYTADPFLLHRGRLHDLSEDQIGEALGELEKAEVIQRYESDGEQWLWFRDTDLLHDRKYLTSDRPRSPYPAPPGYEDPRDAIPEVPRRSPGGPPEVPREHSGSPPPRVRASKPEPEPEPEPEPKTSSPPAAPETPNRLIARDPAAGGLPSPAGPGPGSDFDVNEIFPDHPIPPTTPNPPPADESGGLDELWDEYEQARTMLAASGHPVKAQDGEQERLAVLVRHRGLGVVTEALRQIQIRKARAPTNRMGDGPILDLMTVLDGFSTQLVTKEHLEKGQGEVSGNAKKRYKSRNSKPGYWDDFVQPDPNYRPAA